MDKNIYLYVPRLDELWYRKKLLGDMDTMSYNRGYNINNKNYCKETGCISFPEEDWEVWYNYYVGQEPARYYAYIIADDTFIGDVNIHKNEKMNWYDMGIVIEAKYRGKGYAIEALHLLLDYAFNILGAYAVHNDFEEDRIAAVKTHLSVGFTEYKKQNGIIEFLITKDKYINE